MSTAAAEFTGPAAGAGSVTGQPRIEQAPWASRPSRLDQPAQWLPAGRILTPLGATTSAFPFPGVASSRRGTARPTCPTARIDCMALPMRRYPAKRSQACRTGVRHAGPGRATPPVRISCRPIRRNPGNRGFLVSGPNERPCNHSGRFISCRLAPGDSGPPKVISAGAAGRAAKTIPASSRRRHSIVAPHRGHRSRRPAAARVAWRAALPRRWHGAAVSVPDMIGEPVAPRYQACRSVPVRTPPELACMLIVVECVQRSHSPAHIAPPAIRRTALGRTHQPCSK